MAGYVSKKWLKWLLSKGKGNIVYMIDETCQSPNPLKNKSKRYFNFTFKGKRVVVPKFYQIALPFLEFQGAYYCLKDLGFIGLKRTHTKYFNQLTYNNQLNFVKDIRSIIGNDVKVYADKRPLSKQVAQKTGLIEIKSKAITQRIDAVFGFKTYIYKLKKAKKIKTYSQFDKEYEKAFKNLNIKEI